MKTCALLLAGGEETRFGPIKEFLGSKTVQRINDKDEIIVETLQRCKARINIADIYIITNEKQHEIYNGVLNYTDRSASNYFEKDNYIIEPYPKGTAPCILYAAFLLKQIYHDQDTVMCVFPCDHDIDNDDENMSKFRKALDTAILAAESGKLVTISINPTFAATAYGYIGIKQKMVNMPYFLAGKFKEKPKTGQAENFIKSGFFWNSGMFFWKIDSILESFKRYSPVLYTEFSEIYQNRHIDPITFKHRLSVVYENISEKIFVDTIILEHAADDGNLLVAKGIFNWQDIGKWDALVAIFSRRDNVIDVAIVGIDIQNETLFSTGKHLYKPIINNEYTFCFSDNSLVWLYCDDAQKEKVQKLLMLNDLTGKFELKSIEVDDLQMKALQNEALKEEFEKSSIIQERMMKYINETAKKRANWLMLILLLFMILLVWLFIVLCPDVIDLIKKYLGSISLLLQIISMVLPSSVILLGINWIRKRLVVNYLNKTKRKLGLSNSD